MFPNRALSLTQRSPMINGYQHTQTGYMMIVALGIAFLGIVGTITISGFNWIVFSVLILVGICLLLFKTLTVQIAGDVLEIRFGPGVIRKKLSLKEIESCRMVKNHWYYGWGIRRTPHGWLYNVSGLRAVELQMKSGKKCRIGSDDPDGLAKAIRCVGNQELPKKKEVS